MYCHLRTVRAAVGNVCVFGACPVYRDGGEGEDDSLPLMTEDGGALLTEDNPDDTPLYE